MHWGKHNDTSNLGKPPMVPLDSASISLAALSMQKGSWPKSRYCYENIHTLSHWRQQWHWGQHAASVRTFAGSCSRRCPGSHSPGYSLQRLKYVKRKGLWKEQQQLLPRERGRDRVVTCWDTCNARCLVVLQSHTADALQRQASRGSSPAETLDRCKNVLSSHDTIETMLNVEQKGFAIIQSHLETHRVQCAGICWGSWAPHQMDLAQTCGCIVAKIWSWAGHGSILTVTHVPTANETRKAQCVHNLFLFCPSTQETNPCQVQTSTRESEIWHAAEFKEVGSTRASDTFDVAPEHVGLQVHFPQ